MPMRPALTPSMAAVRPRPTSPSRWSSRTRTPSSTMTPVSPPRWPMVLMMRGTENPDARVSTKKPVTPPLWRAAASGSVSANTMA